jgi:hypothetical protein
LVDEKEEEEEEEEEEEGRRIEYRMQSLLCVRGAMRRAGWCGRGMALCCKPCWLCARVKLF